MVQKNDVVRFKKSAFKQFCKKSASANSKRVLEKKNAVKIRNSYSYSPVIVLLNTNPRHNLLPPGVADSYRLAARWGGGAVSRVSDTLEPRDAKRDKVDVLGSTRDI